MASILLVNGPNLDQLGRREPERYGSVTLAELEKRLTGLATELGHALTAFQSNAEHALIERLHAARDEGVDFVILNPAAFTHTSIALRDAVLGAGLPFIEVHLTNIQAREPFRHRSYFSDIAVGTITGFGAYGYELALRAASQRLQ
ncbi:MAG: type II 3-dehydroquinate dehydratase [Gammaproteobacteria bacterium]